MNYTELVNGIKSGKIKIDSKNHLHNDILPYLERHLQYKQDHLRELIEMGANYVWKHDKEKGPIGEKTSKSMIEMTRYDILEPLTFGQYLFDNDIYCFHCGERLHIVPIDENTITLVSFSIFHDNQDKSGLKYEYCITDGEIPTCKAKELCDSKKMISEIEVPTGKVFINHPCIEKLIKIDLHNEDLIKNIPEEYSNEKIRYVLRCEKDKFGYLPYWNTLDLRQYAASQIGITLKKEELNYHFYPNDFKSIKELPEKYIVINPSITQPYRTWNLENWQKLIDILNDNNINVVAIGKDIFNKSFYDVKIKKGVNLCGDEKQNDLSQVWHILNKSDMFITFDSGLFIFAGSTDTFLLQIGSSLDPEYHTPYRNSSQTYKYEHVDGICKIRCFSNPKYSIQWSGYLGNINGRQMLGYCFKGYVEGNNYDCHPKPEEVVRKVLDNLM